MKVKTALLEGDALNLVVGSLEKQTPSKTTGKPFLYEHWLYLQDFNPSTDWAHGGPIIEREGITIIRVDDKYGVDAEGFTTRERIPVWCASIGQNQTWSTTSYEAHDPMFQIYEEEVMYGLTPLVAAMKRYVASKLGDEVEIPNELLP